jgi:hypothetical protein
LSVERQFANSPFVNLHHITALALVGWYLMLPPDGKPTAPLSQWTLVRSYDNVGACEKLRDDSITAAMQLWSAARRKNPESQETETAKQVWKESYDPKCIASDDPRLREK